MCRSGESAPHTQKAPHPEGHDALAIRRGELLLVAALVTRLTKQLPVLLLRHTLPALLDN